MNSNFIRIGRAERPAATINNLLLFMIILFAFFLVFGVACTDSGNRDSTDSKQNKICKSVEIIGIKTLTTVSDGHFQFPIFSKDSKKIYFTSSGYRGIYTYDIDKQELHTINDETGSGYQFVVSANGEKVYYRSEEPMVKRRRQFMLYEQDLASGKSRKLLEKSARHISGPRLIKNDIIIYSIDDKPKLIHLNRVEENNNNLNVSYYTIQKNEISIHQPGRDIYQINFEDHSLLWPEWESSGERMIVYASGLGLQLIDPLIMGSQVLGDFRAAKWSPFKNMIVYMHDIDDGERILESDIFIYDFLDKTSKNLTQTPEVIEMYPVWSPDGGMIAYHTIKGNIEVLELNINLAGE